MRSLLLAALLAAPAGASEFSRLALEAEDQGDPAKQLELYVAAAKAWTTDDNRDSLRIVYTQIGSVLQKRGRAFDSIDFFNQAVAMKPDDATSLNNRGTSFQMMHGYERALKDHLAAARLAPREPAVRQGLCYDYAMLGRWREAEKSCREALDLGGKNTLLLQNLALIYAELGRPEDARKHLALSAGAPHTGGIFEYQRYLFEPSARMTSAWVLWLCDRKPVEAERLLDKLIEENPKTAMLFLRRGQFRLRTGRVEKAIEDFDQARKLDAYFIDALALRAAAHAKAGRSALAEADRTQACKAGWPPACRVKY